MATYTYKAITESGLVVRNRIEAPTKQSIVKMLKNNNLLPISIDKMPYGQKKQKRKAKKNENNMEEMMKNINTTQISDRRELSTTEKIRLENQSQLIAILKLHQEILWYLHRTFIY